jgi:hypothetical protein
MEVIIECIWIKKQKVILLPNFFFLKKKKTTVNALRHEWKSKSAYPSKYGMQNILKNRGKLLRANKGK